MVYLILSKKRFADLKAEFKSSGNSYWISESILSKQEAEEYWKQSVNLTVIDGSIRKSNKKEIDNVLLDIAEHHPGKTIWIENESAL